MRKSLFAVLALCCASLAHATPQRFQALLESDWQWTLRHLPEFATTVGDTRYNDSLTDTAPAAVRARHAHQREMLDAARAIDRAALSGQDRLSYDLFVHDKETAVTSAALQEIPPYPLTHVDGIHITFPQLVAQMPFDNARDYHDYLARLRGLPKHIDGIVAQLTLGMASGRVAPSATMRIVPDQLRAFTAAIDDGPLAEPFRDIPATIPKGTRDRLREDGARVLREIVGPAFARLEAFVRDAYLPKCRPTIAASALPDGAAWYAHEVRRHTTTRMTPQEIHALGLREVARLQAELDALMRRTGFQGTRADFARFLNSDPRFFYTREADLLDGYRAILRKALAGAPRLFGRLPAMPIEVRAMPGPDAASQAAGYYEAGTTDGARPGYFVANLSNLQARPKWAMEALTLHEAVPGHHLQAALAQELRGLPAFRRFGTYGAYDEGWALYAESLGGELGFYSDPYSLAGRIDAELFRAARLVVDTGIHALGWSREQAVAWLDANTLNPPQDNRAEVDRYIVWPGQALGYKIGQLRILALRNKAKAALGPAFDLRAFHDALLADGPLPLDLLEARIDEWIAARRRP